MILAVDIGTSSIKGAIISPEGYAFAYHKVHLFPEDRNYPGEGYAGSWKSGFIEIASILRRQDISAVVISGNGPTIVPLGKEGEILHTPLMWMGRENSSLEGTHSFYLPKINWLKENCPSVYEATDVFLTTSSYITWLLTGEKAVVSAHDEFDRYIWSGQDIEKYHMKESRFPPIVTMGAVIGKISSAGSSLTGLPAGVPVVGGGVDFMVSLIGTGVVRPGRTCDRAGTSEGINFCSDKPVPDTRLRTLPHAVEGLYNVSGILSSTGSLFEWYRRITGQENYGYAETLSAIKSVAAGSGTPMFFPGLKDGGLWEFSNGMAVGLEAYQGRNELGRAVMESIGYAVRRAVELFEENDCPIGELRVSGGQGKNVIWNQIKADITGCSILVPEVEDAELLGGACLASAALGRFDNFLEASDELVRIKKIFYPDKKEEAVYREEYEKYKAVSEEAKKFLRNIEEMKGSF
ncbi:xylulokinase [Spirochaeta isovalerica]|uniref:Xylulokinase n=1 Tax=Spirochaeta isovalerica TaxID=150 RepID=A0A841RIR0_9SPIO|nr:FGGY-family carbohydrate kinase [Spirochaeta isovalerica]MBB6482192.1 xylulokinase [Spirochaeta isovalerica]